jgi:hypothetical protein
MNKQSPLPHGVAALGEVRCVGETLALLAGRRIQLPSKLVGSRLQFRDGTSARVYRETVVTGRVATDPCVLLVEFRLRLVHGWGHAIFRWESLLNTPLFVGFPGFVSKLWLAHDQHGFYRGVYEWDGADRAEHYARCLWRVLALGCEPGTIHYRVLPGMCRDEFLEGPKVFDLRTSAGAGWWELLEAA